MFITVLWAIGFCIGMILTIPILFLCYMVKLVCGSKISDKFTYCFTKFWAKSIILTTGSKVSVLGYENLSAEKNICFICNHQGFFDIPVLMGWLGRPVGFVAKKELQKIPVLSGWIKAIHSAFVDRSNARKAIDSINQAAAEIKIGHAIVIFPEGSRSKTGEVGDFKTGSLKLAFNANAIIQPITIYGTRKMYEDESKIHKANVIIQIHKPIKQDDDIYSDKQRLINQINGDIRENYYNLSVLER